MGRPLSLDRVAGWVGGARLGNVEPERGLGARKGGVRGQPSRGRPDPWVCLGHGYPSSAQHIMGPQMVCAEGEDGKLWISRLLQRAHGVCVCVCVCVCVWENGGRSLSFTSLAFHLPAPRKILKVQHLTTGTGFAEATVAADGLVRVTSRPGPHQQHLFPCGYLMGTGT